MDSYYNKNKRKDIIDDLTANQLNRLDESIRQAETGQIIPNVAMKKKMQQWLIDEDRNDWYPACNIELKKRVREIRQGKVKGIPADEVFAKLEEKYH